jgi:hypothetical protein
MTRTTPALALAFLILALTPVAGAATRVAPPEADAGATALVAPHIAPPQADLQGPQAIAAPMPVVTTLVSTNGYDITAAAVGFTLGATLTLGLALGVSHHRRHTVGMPRAAQ